MDSGPRRPDLGPGTAIACDLRCGYPVGRKGEGVVTRSGIVTTEERVAGFLHTHTHTHPNPMYDRCRTEKEATADGGSACGAQMPAWQTSQYLCEAGYEPYSERLKDRPKVDLEAVWSRTREQPETRRWRPDSANTRLKPITKPKVQWQSAPHVLSRIRGLRVGNRTGVFPLGLLGWSGGRGCR